MKHFFKSKIFRSIFPIGGFTFCLVLVSFLSNAQNRWSVEFRPGYNIPTNDIDLKNGFGLEGTVAYRFVPYLGAYAGWSWSRFASEEYLPGLNVDFDESGLSFGLQSLYPLGNSETSLLLRLGGLWNQVEIKDNDGSSIFDTGYGFGWQA